MNYKYIKPLSRYICCALTLLVVAQGRAEEFRSFAISANALRNEQGEIQVRFSMRNTTSKAIRLFSALLPWEMSSSLIFIFREQDGGLREGSDFSFGFPTAGETVIQPQQEISGSVNLKNPFGSAATVLDGGGYLYWSYAIKRGDNITSSDELYGGVLLITKKPSSRNSKPKP
jgi:hypothetical protein